MKKKTNFMVAYWKRRKLEVRVDTLQIERCTPEEKQGLKEKPDILDELWWGCTQ